MKQSELIEKVFTVLGERYGDSTTELVYQTPFQLLVCVMLSAQTTDKRVNIITPGLFDKYPDAFAMSTATPEELHSYIKTVNYANAKSRHLATTAQKLRDRQKENSLGWDQIPGSMEELILLPGVGEKTAKVILNTLFDHKVIAVDTHVHRVSNRLGLVKTNAPLQTSKQLEKIVPEKYKSFAHHGLIFFGRYQCTARKPRCSDCPFQSFCPYFQKVLKNTKNYS